MTDTNLATRRIDAEVELQALRRKRGAAHLDKQKFEHHKITKIENEIADIDAAADEQVRRNRDEVQIEFTKRRSLLRKELKKLESERLGYMQDANIACRTLAENIHLILESNRRMSEISCALSGKLSPTPLQAPDLVVRLAGRISSVMSSIPGHLNRLGSLEWSAKSLYRHSDDWRECERALLEPHLKQLLQGE